MTPSPTQPTSPRTIRPEDVLQHLPSGVVVLGAGGTIEHINPAVLALFGQPADDVDLLGRDWRSLFERIAPSLQDPGGTLPQIEALFRRDQSSPIEFALRDGRRLLQQHVPLERAGTAGAVLWQIQDVTAVRATQLRLQYLSERDPLTDLLNRRGFDLEIERAQHQYADGTPFALALIDLDNFKRVNDTLGHAAGDAALVEVASRLHRLHRLSDMTARIGGDEFAILMPECRTQGEAHDIGERLLRAMDAPLRVHGVDLELHFSVGLALRAPGDDARRLFDHADLALYDAKSSGRNRAVVFSPGLQLRHDRLRCQREALRQALADGRLELFYQPVVSLEPEHGRIAVRKLEALLRMRDPQGSVHCAEEFESALDDPELGIEIDRFVLQTALEQIDRWRNNGLDLRLAVNVSPRHFSHPDFVRSVKDLLASRPGVLSQQLTVEVTQHGQPVDPHTVDAAVAALRRLGCRISLDDFGTGSASLAHLQQFDVAMIRIDPAFVRDLLDDGLDRSAGYGMLRMARLFGVDAIAEGVETPLQCRALAALGFRHFQGYGLARPMPAADVEAWLSRRDAALAWLRPLAWPRLPEIRIAVEALSSHRLLVRRLLWNTMEAEETADLRQSYAGNACDLAGWLDREAQRWPDSALLRRLAEAHADFHRQVAAAIDSRDADAGSRLHACDNRLHAAFWDWLLHHPEIETPAEPISVACDVAPPAAANRHDRANRLLPPPSPVQTGWPTRPGFELPTS